MYYITYYYILNQNVWRLVTRLHNGDNIPIGIMVTIL